MKNRAGTDPDNAIIWPRRKPLAKAMIRLNLALEMFVKAAQDSGDTKQALIASELFILKAWHRIQCAESAQPKSVYEAFDHLMTTYFDAALHYYSKMAPYMTVRDGMSGYSHESTEYPARTYLSCYPSAKRASR